MPDIIDIQEDFQGRGKSEEVDGRGIRVAKYTRHFWARLLRPDIDPATVLLDARIPVMWAFYSAGGVYDGGARCVKRDARQTNPYTVEVDLEYTTKWAEVADPITNPLDMPYKVSWGCRDFQAPCEKDFTTPDAYDCLNSADEPFDPPLISDSAALTLNIEANRAFFDPIFEDYLDPKAVNDALFFGFDEGKVKVNSIRGTQERDADFTYMKMQFEFWVRKGGWDVVPLDQGYSYIDLVDGVQTPIIEPGGGTPAKPKLLNGAGQPLTIPFPAGTSAVFLDGLDGRRGPFRVQPRKPFSVFGIT